MKSLPGPGGGSLRRLATRRNPARTTPGLDMEDRRKVVELLKPERMGVILSDELMLHPE